MKAGRHDVSGNAAGRTRSSYFDWYNRSPHGQDGGTTSPGHPRLRQADLSKGMACGERWKHQCASRRLRCISPFSGCAPTCPRGACPPVATGFAVAGRPLNLALLPEVSRQPAMRAARRIWTPRRPQRSPMACRPLFPHAILLGNHGLVCYCEDVYQGLLQDGNRRATSRASR